MKRFRRSLAFLLAFSLVLTSFTTDLNTVLAEEPVPVVTVQEDAPITEEPAVEEPVAEEPVAEEPVVETPVAEEPVVETPVAEEPVAEEPVEEVAYPAVNFAPVSLNGVTVSVAAPEGAFPEGTQMSVTAVASASVVSEIDAATQKDVEAEDIKAMDITFTSEGIEVQPLVPISVSFSNIALDGDTLQVFHMEDENSAAQAVTGEQPNDKAIEVSVKDFSVYVVVGGTNKATPAAGQKINTASGAKVYYVTKANAGVKTVNGVNYIYSGSVTDVTFAAASLSKVANQRYEGLATPSLSYPVYYEKNNNFIAVDHFTIYKNGNQAYVVRAYFADGTFVDYVKGTENKESAKFLWLSSEGLEYTATFDKNGGTGAEIAEVKSEDGVVVMPAAEGLVKNGNEFLGWATTKDASVPAYKAGDEVELSANTTFYAVFSKNCSVKYDINGGTGTTPTQANVKSGDEITLASADGFSKTNNVFLGWSLTKISSLNPAGTTEYKTVFQAGSVEVVENDVTYYAVWGQNAGRLDGKITIAIRQDGSVPDEPAIYGDEYHFLTQSTRANVLDYIKVAQTTVGVNAVAPLLTDYFYTFVNNANAGNKYWNSQTEYIEWYVIKYQSNDQAFHIDGVKRQKSKVNLSYDRNGSPNGYGLAPLGKQYNNGEEATVENGTITRPGYTLGGWNTAADGSGTQYVAGDKITMTSNITLYAQWVPSNATPYTVAYYYADADRNYSETPTSTDATRTARTNSTVNVTVADKTPTVDGYYFDSENKDNVLSGTVAADGTTVLKVYFQKSAKLTVVEHNYSDAYDGNAHSAYVTVSEENASITYSYDGEDSTSPIEFTSVGTYYVSYTVAKENFETETGRLKVEITAATIAARVAGADTYVYDGLTHDKTVDVTQPVSGYTVTKWTDDTKTTRAVPGVNVGTYNVYFEVSAPNYETISGSYSYEITKADDELTLDKEEVDLSDGEEVVVATHTGDGDVTAESADEDVAVVEVTRNNDGGYDVVVTPGTKPGTTTITVSSADTDNYNGDSKTITVTFTGTIEDTSDDEVFYYDGTAHSANVSSSTEGVKVEYKVNGRYTEVAPTFTEAGQYTVEYRLSAENYATIEASTTVTINRLNVEIRKQNGNKTDRIGTAIATEAFYNSTVDGFNETITNAATVKSNVFGSTVDLNDTSIQIIDMHKEASGWKIIVADANVNAGFYLLKSGNPAPAVGVSDDSKKYIGLGNGTIKYYDENGVALENVVGAAEVAARVITAPKTLPAVAFTNNAKSDPAVKQYIINAGYNEAEINYFNLHLAYYRIQHEDNGWHVDLRVVDGNGNPYTHQSFDVTFTYGDNKTKTIRKEFGEAVVAADYPDSARLGYTFTGWEVTEKNANLSFVTMNIHIVATYTKNFANGQIKVQSYEGVYDQKAHSITVTVDRNVRGAKVLYSTTKDGRFTETLPKYTDFTDGPVTVYFKVTAPGYTDSEVMEGTVNIKKAPGKVTLAYNKATITYPASLDVNVTKNISGGKLSVSSEDTSVATASMKRTGVVFKSDVLAMQSQTNAGTVVVTVTSAETLNYLAASTTFTLTVKNANFVHTPLNYVGTYDGQYHTGAVSVLYPTGAFARDLKVEFATVNADGSKSDWSATKPSFKDAGTYTVAYKLSKPGFNSAEGRFTVKIGKKLVVVATAGGIKEFDGTPLTNPNYKIGVTDYFIFIPIGVKDTFVKGEGAVITTTGSQTLIGSSLNDFSIEYNENTNPDNYVIKKCLGTLVVTGRKTAYNIVLNGNSDDTPVYDGTEKSVAGYASATIDGVEATAIDNENGTITFTMANGAVFTVSGITTTISGTDAATYGEDDAVTDRTGLSVKLGDAEVLSNRCAGAQFTVTVVPGTLTVNPRTVILESASAEKEYDGDPLTAETFSVSETSPYDFVEGQGVVATFTGSQTLVGTSKNYFTVEADENTKASNYDLTTLVYGDLTVIDREDKYEIALTPNSAEYVYDATEKTVEGFEELTFTVDGHEYTVEGLEAGAVGTNAGTYDVEVSGEAVVVDAEGNDVTAQFNVEVGEATLTITKATLTVTVNNATKTYGYKNPEFTVTYDGFLGDDDETVLGGELTFITTATQVSHSGDYPVSATGLEADNYDIVYVDGILTIVPGNPAPQPGPVTPTPTPTPTPNPTPNPTPTPEEGGEEPTPVEEPEEEPVEVPGELVPESANDEEAVTVPEEIVPESANHDNCMVHIVVLVLALLYGVYSAILAYKRRREIKELEGDDTKVRE